MPLRPVQVPAEGNYPARGMAKLNEVEKMQTETEIRETIAKLRAAMDSDGFKPVVDGKNLKEHVYFIRLGAIQYLEDVVRTQEEIDEAEANIP